jgi:putative inorganic carbon (HCO3(-)) transporter
MTAAVGRFSGRTHLLGEGVVLFLATPFLLFPAFSSPATAAALLVIALTWIVNWRRFPQTPLNGALLIWGLSLAVGILVSADPDLTLPKATGLILGLAAWRYTSLFVTDARRLRWAGAAYLLLALGFVLLGILGADWRLKIPWLASVINLAPSALLRLPEAPNEGVQLNQLAGTLLLALPLTVSLALNGSIAGLSRSRRRALGALSLVLLGLLVLSQSRGGWLGGMVGLGALAWLWWRALPAGPLRRRAGLSFAGFLLIVVLAVAVIGPANLQSLWQEPPRDTVLGNLGTLGFRQEVWRWALVGIEDFPFTGTGLGTFRRVAPRLYPIAVPATYDIAHAHNIFLQVALDLGLPGLAAYLALLALALRLGWQAARRDPALRPWAWGLCAGLLALHAYGLADALAPGSKPALLFWLALGLLCAMPQSTRPDSGSETINVHT